MFVKCGRFHRIILELVIVLYINALGISTHYLQNVIHMVYVKPGSLIPLFKSKMWMNEEFIFVHPVDKFTVYWKISLLSLQLKSTTNFNTRSILTAIHVTLQNDVIVKTKCHKNLQ